MFTRYARLDQKTREEVSSVDCEYTICLGLYLGKIIVRSVGDHRGFVILLNSAFQNWRPARLREYGLQLSISAELLPDLREFEKSVTKPMRTASTDKRGV